MSSTDTALLQRLDALTAGFAQLARLMGARLTRAEVRRQALEEAAEIAKSFTKRDFNWGSENADRYHAQADWVQLIEGAIRALKEKPDA